MTTSAFAPIRIETTPDLVEIRRHLHAHPERSFAEHATSAYLADQLRAHGVEVLDLPAPLETGVIGLIEGTAGPGPRVGLRADIDGLRVTERTGLPYASVNEGVMHACGHDLHMTGLLGAAFWLAAHRDRFAGSVKIVFQPAEELGLGARRCIEAGVADDLAAIVGTHNNPNYAPGEVAVGVEPMMAGCVKFRVDLHAQGTHAGYPHKGTGPIEALASMILALQTIVSRNISPFHAVVLSVTEVHGGDVWNVVPAEAGFQGTVRFFDNDDERIVERRFRDEVESTARAYGIAADIDWDVLQRPLVGDPRLSQILADDVPAYARLRPIRPSMAGEDFEEFAKRIPVAFAFVGSNGEPGCADWHSPEFVGLDGAIGPGASFYANAALRLLRELA
ncbi:n-acyl-L-amino acid amidohydrolase [Bifidobacterium sp. DSM 109958]|uniref:N-acyl-L-amino acid amidohydrolase n=1 Tax=Bifidobacterium moraviense TaxID=2675323 RepID=A0A7Y0EZV8_9BIFI|nr:amidohydrolase [Bifidobacterium sp. DSM 109958]NMM99449.1 n-acyl-L-amino acid amidohydrolase [Bifidobacterium sp. DSM 109958]